MRLTEGTHFERVTIEERKFVYAGGELLGYCAYNRDGKAVILRRTHPDIHEEDLLEEGEALRRQLMARNGRLDSARQS